MMKKVAVLGLGRFGAAVARSLSRQGNEVLAVDRNINLVSKISDEVSVAVGFDATDLANLKAYDVGSFDTAVIGIGANFEASVLVTMNCKNLGVKEIYAKALNPLQESVLKKVGADHVIKPEEDMGGRLANHITKDSVVDFVELPDGYSLRRLFVPSEWDGKTIEELALPRKLRLNLIQVIKLVDGPEPGSAQGQQKIPLPTPDLVLNTGDEIDVIGPDKALKKLE
jgi:trk system potassium uptake protein